jgi:hypothetical protein
MINIPSALRTSKPRLQFPATPSHPATPLTGKALVGGPSIAQLNSVDFWRRKHGLPQAAR